MAKRRMKPAAPPAPPPANIGIKFDNITPVIPADNEHSSAGAVAIARAVEELAKGVSACARALEETARHTQKNGVYIRDLTVHGPL